MNKTFVFTDLFHFIFADIQIHHNAKPKLVDMKKDQIQTTVHSF